MTSIEKAVEDIKNVKVQGAKEIAVYGLSFLREFCMDNGFGFKFEIASKTLEEARPTAVVLHNCLEILRKERKIETIDKLIKQLEKATNEIAMNGSKIIKNGCKIMTHCHSGEALAIIKDAGKAGKKISVYATVTEPLEQGVKTANEMAESKIPVTLICDSAAGFFMKDVDIVLVGSDAIRLESEEFVNKTGTLLLALAAKEYKKPLYVAANTLKIDRRKKFVIEERPTKEISEYLFKKISQEEIKIRNPAFDIIPLKFVKGIITEKGIVSTKKIMRM